MQNLLRILYVSCYAVTQLRILYQTTTEEKSKVLGRPELERYLHGLTTASQQWNACRDLITEDDVASHSTEKYQVHGDEHHADISA